MNNILPLIVLTIGGLFLFSKNKINNLLSELTITFKGVQPDIMNLRIALIFNFYNPFPGSISLTSIFGNVTMNGKPIMDFYNVTPQEIQSGNNQVIIYTTPTPAGVNNLINQISTGNVKANYTLNSGPLTYSDAVNLM